MKAPLPKLQTCLRTYLGIYTWMHNSKYGKVLLDNEIARRGRAGEMAWGVVETVVVQEKRSLTWHGTLHEGKPRR